MPLFSEHLPGLTLQDATEIIEKKARTLGIVGQGLAYLFQKLHEKGEVDENDERIWYQFLSQGFLQVA